MRKHPTDIIEAGRVVKGAFATTKADRMMGAFFAKCPTTDHDLKIFASDANSVAAWGWEHVSISMQSRCPAWEDMCWVKDQFWNEDELVVQYHPPKSEYVSWHPFTLHLWANVHLKIPAPPKNLVGGAEENPDAVAVINKLGWFR